MLIPLAYVMRGDNMIDLIRIIAGLTMIFFVSSWRSHNPIKTTSWDFHTYSVSIYLSND